MTPIERAAHALFAEMKRQEGGFQGTSDELDENLIAGYIDYSNVDMGKLARAVLEAIREPSEAMIASCGDLACSQQEVWQRSIDAALAEGLGE